MFSNFSNLSIVDPNCRPIINVDPNAIKSYPKSQSNSYYPNNYYQSNKNYNYNRYQNPKHNFKYGKYPKKETRTLLVDLEDKQVDKASSATPIQETENKEEVASRIYEVVDKKYPE